MDYLFLDSYNEIGCGEAGLVGGANTTKELSHTMSKMPKVMKDALMKLVWVSLALKNDPCATGNYKKIVLRRRRHSGPMDPYLNSRRSCMEYLQAHQALQG
ncbi:hypothetical protein [Parasitella parasitica]|uniref:Uncharacterized protein n=1 Tax=Parasitella parasitica TaxID=35722 RepID=A0A0B7MTV4_9FUNG|nr:hypothetical protein [Parasitella parasitica]